LTAGAVFREIDPVMELIGIAELLDFPREGEVRLGDEEVRRAIYQAHKGTDFWSRAPLAYDRMHLDHVVPRSRLGSDNVFNLVPTCQPLNGAKSDRYDQTAIVPVLSILRLYFGPKILAKLRLGRWWRVDPRVLLGRMEEPRPEALSRFLGTSRKGNWTVLDWFVECRRMEIANHFWGKDTDPGWSDLARQVCEYADRLQDDQDLPDDFRLACRYLRPDQWELPWAWRRVVSRDRSETPDAKVFYGPPCPGDQTQ
jgi:hypothetical protein